MDRKFKGGLKRLDGDAYRGHARVHWSVTIASRKVGWLNSLMHLKIREALLHSLSRHDLVCCVYCLMPDHAHFLIGGFNPFPDSDERLAMAHFRKEWNRQLKNLATEFVLQKQAYDHVLTKRELTDRNLFQTQAGYILNNPVRGGLVECFSEWEFCGSIIPGYPGLAPRDEGFWDTYWKVFNKVFVDE